MAKLPRVFQNQFGLNGAQAHFGQFGSRASGPGTETKDPSSIQSLSAFVQNGWLDAIVAGNTTPFLEDMNGLMYLLFYQICYGFQSGIPEWDPSTEYDIGSIVRKTGTTELYGSLINLNVGNTLPNQTANGNWNYLNPQSVPAGTVTEFAGTLAPFGWLLCDGTAYAQGSFPALVTAIGTTWNTFAGNSDPGVGNFRVPDLRGRTGIGVGTGNGLSARTLAQALGEETHVLSIPEMPQHNHGISDPGHSHPGGAGDGGGQVASGGSGFPRVNLPPTGSATTGIGISNTGGSGAHNNMQPSAGINKIIKT